MRLALAVVLLLGATPAFATGGMLCRPVSGEGPALSLVIGHGVPGAIVGASLIEPGATRSTMGENAPLLLAQAWMDDELLLVDLADPQALCRIARLRARFHTAGRGPVTATGTLAVAGRAIRVRCVES